MRWAPVGNHTYRRWRSRDDAPPAQHEERCASGAFAGSALGKGLPVVQTAENTAIIRSEMLDAGAFGGLNSVLRRSTPGFAPRAKRIRYRRVAL